MPTKSPTGPKAAGERPFLGVAPADQLPTGAGVGPTASVDARAAIGSGCARFRPAAPTGARPGVYLEFLQGHGYVLSEAKRQELDRATAAEDADPGE